MPARVQEMIREDVLQSWLGGSSFHAISIKHAISEGSINNIIAEKKKQHGSDQMNFYRELGVAMSKSGLNVQQCARDLPEIANLKLLRDYQSVALNLTPEVKNVVDSLLRTGIQRSREFRN